MARPSFGYRNAAGQKVPGSTTVLKNVSTMDSDILCGWAAGLARRGQNWREVRSAAGAHGTMLHELCETRLPHALVESDKPAAATPEAWEKLKASYAAIRTWELLHAPETLIAEEPLVSEVLQFGGTLDRCARFPRGIEGTPVKPGSSWLLDYKTGSMVGAKEAAQMASYRELLAECRGIFVDGAILIHAPTKEPGYMRPVYLDGAALDMGMNVFRCGLAIGHAAPRLAQLCD